MPKNQVSVNLNMVETRDSVAETQRQTRVSVSGYITVSHVSVAAFSTEPEHFFYMFPTDFRFRNHVFPQSLKCVYVAETRYSVPETCYFVRSTGGNVKIRSGNLTCFSVFPLLRKYVQKVSYLPKPGFPMAIFLYSYMKLTFEYFSWLTYMQ